MSLNERIMRGYHIRNPETGEDGPWLAGMTLDPSVVSEVWCHQRDYVCMIKEYGGRPIESGEPFRAAFIVEYFDSIEEMHAVYDAHKWYTWLSVSEESWELVDSGRRHSACRGAISTSPSGQPVPPSYCRHFVSRVGKRY